MKYKCHESCPPHREGETPKCRNNNGSCSGIVEIIVVIGLLIAALRWIM